MSVIELRESTGVVNDNSKNSAEKFNNCVLAICEQYPQEDPYKIPRYVLKAASTVISAVAKVPFAPISLRLGPVLGPISIAGNSSGFFILEYWAAAGTVDDLLGPMTKPEMELLRAKSAGAKKTCRTVVIISIASLIALSSQLPIALAGVDYNATKYRVVAGVVLLVAGALIPVRSLQLSIEQIRRTAQKSVRSEITQIRTKMIALIKEAQDSFIQKSWDQKKLFIQQKNEISKIDSPTDKTRRYMQAMLSCEFLPVSCGKKIVRGICNYTGLVIGGALAGIFGYASGEYTYTLTKKELWDNEVAGVVFAILAVGSTAYLFGKSIVFTTRGVFNLVGNFATGKEIRNLGWQLKPALSFTLTALGLLIDFTALGPTYIIWGDFYNQTEVKHHFFQKTMCASLFVLLFTSTLDIIDEIVTLKITQGTEEELEVLRINEEFQKLATLIAKSPTQDFIKYLLYLGNSDQTSFLDRMNVSTDELRSYAENLQINS